jgi:hypothetical protein
MLTLPRVPFSLNTRGVPPLQSRPGVAGSLARVVALLQPAPACASGPVTANPAHCRVASRFPADGWKPVTHAWRSTKFMLERRQRFLEKALLGNETVYVLDDGAVLRFSDGVVETSAS